jgi:hypothetical protein
MQTKLSLFFEAAGSTLHPVNVCWFRQSNPHDVLRAFTAALEDLAQAYDGDRENNDISLRPKLTPS